MLRSIFLLGAARGTGNAFLAAALAAGHHVTALARDPSRLPARPGLTVLGGDATDEAAVCAGIVGHDAVVCALGAPPKDRSRVRERGTAALVEGMKRSGARRLVVLSSHGVGDSAHELPWWMRYLVVPLYLAPVFADHDAQERVVRASGLDWTLLRPGWLADGPATGAVGPVDGKHLRITRADVARELLRCVEDDHTIGQTRPIANH